MIHNRFAIGKTQSFFGEKLKTNLNEIIDEEGWVLEKISEQPLPPLNEDEKKRLSSYLDEPFQFGVQNIKYTRETTLRNVLEHIISDKRVAIEDIEIIGSAIFYILGTDYVVRALAQIGVELDSESLKLLDKKISKKPNDLDIRINIPNHNPYQFDPRATIVEYIDGLVNYRAIDLKKAKNFFKEKTGKDASDSSTLSTLLSKELPFEKYYTTDAKNPDQYSIVGFNKFDINFVRYLKRKNGIFSTGSLHLTNFLNPNAELKPHSEIKGGWQAIIDFVRNTMHPIDIKKADEADWKKLLSGYVNGKTHLIEGLDKGLTLAMLKNFERFRKNDYRHPKNIGQYVACLLNDTLNSHHKNYKSARLFLTLYSLKILNGLVEETDLKSLVVSMELKPSYSFEELSECIEKKEIPFKNPSQVDAELQLSYIEKNPKKFLRKWKQLKKTKKEFKNDISPFIATLICNFDSNELRKDFKEYCDKKFLSPKLLMRLDEVEYKRLEGKDPKNIQRIDTLFLTKAHKHNLQIKYIHSLVKNEEYSSALSLIKKTNLTKKMIEDVEISILGLTSKNKLEKYLDLVIYCIINSKLDSKLYDIILNSESIPEKIVKNCGIKISQTIIGNERKLKWFNLVESQKYNIDWDKNEISLFFKACIGQVFYNPDLVKTAMNKLVKLDLSKAKNVAKDLLKEINPEERQEWFEFFFERGVVNSEIFDQFLKDLDIDNAISWNNKIPKENQDIWQKYLLESAEKSDNKKLTLTLLEYIDCNEKNRSDLTRIIHRQLKKTKNIPLNTYKLIAKFKIRDEMLWLTLMQNSKRIDRLIKLFFDNGCQSVAPLKTALEKIRETRTLQPYIQSNGELFLKALPDRILDQNFYKQIVCCISKKEQWIQLIQHLTEFGLPSTCLDVWKVITPDIQDRWIQFLEKYESVPVENKRICQFILSIPIQTRKTTAVGMNLLMKLLSEKGSNTDRWCVENHKKIKFFIKECREDPRANNIISLLPAQIRSDFKMLTDPLIDPMLKLARSVMIDALQIFKEELSQNFDWACEKIFDTLHEVPLKYRKSALQIVADYLEQKREISESNFKTAYQLILVAYIAEESLICLDVIRPLINVLKNKLDSDDLIIKKIETLGFDKSIETPSLDIYFEVLLDLISNVNKYIGFTTFGFSKYLEHFLSKIFSANGFEVDSKKRFDVCCSLFEIMFYTQTLKFKNTDEEKLEEQDYSKTNNIETIHKFSEQAIKNSELDTVLNSRYLVSILDQYSFSKDKDFKKTVLNEFLNMIFSRLFFIDRHITSLHADGISNKEKIYLFKEFERLITQFYKFVIHERDNILIYSEDTYLDCVAFYINLSNKYLKNRFYPKEIIVENCKKLLRVPMSSTQGINHKKMLIEDMKKIGSSD